MDDLFTRFADKATSFTAKPHFFTFCVLVVVLWLPSYFLLQSIDTWQLIINTLTTIVTFLLVALFQNDQERFEQATNEKLNAIAKGIGDLLEGADKDTDAQELYKVMGLENEVRA